jgi:two-component system, OmpR family, osmolarity sensor histidine kinase EnvZ
MLCSWMKAEIMRLSLYDRFNNFLETYAPHGLYGRTLAILITPVVLLQLLMAGVILERYWDNVTKVLARSLSNEIGLLIDIYEKSDKSDAALQDLEKVARDRLRINLNYARGVELPQTLSAPIFSLFDAKIKTYLAQESGRKFWVNSQAANGQVEIKVEVEKGLIFTTQVDADRAHAVGTPLMIVFMVFSTLALTAIAVIFLRNQIRPILNLTRAAQAFGKGREIQKYNPSGATEVRLAGEAFLDMKRRIARHVEQRTTMLAGVSHDLRTILTRFKLELAVLGDTARTKPLREDVNEMQQMLEDYMAFVRGDGGEQVSELVVPNAVRSAVESLSRGKVPITVQHMPDLTLMLKVNAFRRLLTNVLSNAVRYGKHVIVSGEVHDERLWVYVDDDGPGIPEHKREDAFRPFVRLDEARNLDHSGTGLGLAIALDIAHAQGGDIMLQDSKLGGLRVAIKIPI